MTESAQLVNGGDLREKPRRIARFGIFEVDLRTSELRRNGAQVRIQEQPLRILALLLERAGEIVTREELRERIWPAEFVDFDHSLNTAIRKLREALGDSAENPRFVETLARRGYRFIAPVSWDVSDAAPKTPRLLIPIGILVVLLAAAGAYFVWRRPPAVAPPNPIDAVAVLPFTNDDAQSQHLSDGMTEILIDTLSRVPDLRVMARTTVFDYKGKKIDPREAGRALNVSGVIVGHLRRQGDRYEIHVELIDVKDGTQLWGDHFDATSATLSAVQSRISEELTSELKQGVSRERRVASKRYTRDPQAYDDYLWGLYAWNKRDVQSAVTYFNSAIQRDPNFAAAYAGLANAYGVMVGYGTISVADGTAKVLSNAGRALQLDPNNAEALVSIATTKYRNLWDFPGADADYKRALALNPNYATGHQWYSDYLRTMGRWSEGRREVDIAHQLDPRSWAINIMRCYGRYYERRYREAIEVSHQAGELAAPGCVARCLIALGDIEGVLPLLKKTNVPDRDREQIEAAYRQSGRRGFFRKSAELLARRQSENVETPVDIAALYAWAGDTDQAFAWLEKAYQRRVSRVTNMNIEPAFDSLRSDPRFDDLLRRIGLPRVNPPSS
ncbi:MAG: winged helix-turn-helix domain-containing protein [Acidobacteriota bacterium]|nr:winged helix-turn-helix domain-containing protein [Acidobacteriota bacterium]